MSAIHVRGERIIIFAIRFEVDDLELQDEPLQIRIMDYDTYSANDAIGKVYIDLNPLLLSQPSQRSSNSNTGDSGGGES